MTLRSSRSEPGLDVLRGVLVLAMFAVHARRLQPASTHLAGTADRLLDALMWAEPLIAAGFLFVVGTSIVLSHESAARRGLAWKSKLLRRSAALYALAIVLFLPQYGVELPDLVLSPGILSAIAVSIAGVGLALETRRPMVSLAAIATAGLAVTALLDSAGVSVPGVNAGPGGALPLVSFAAGGGLLELLRRRHGPRALGAFAMSALPLLALVLVSGARWTTERASFYADHAGLLALPSLLGSAQTDEVAVLFWNHSALGAIGLLAPLAGAMLASIGSPRAVTGSPAFAPLALLGRHALAAYVLHLGALGLVELGGWSPRSASGTWALVAALAALAGLVSAALDRRRAQSLAASATAATSQTRIL